MSGIRGTPEAILQAHGDVLAPSDAAADWKAQFSGSVHLPAEAEEALALRFAEEYVHCLRYCAAWSCWLVYGGGVWQRDSTLEVLARVRLLCRKAAETESDAKLKLRLASQTTVAAVERLARADPRLAGTTDQWDTSPDLLNTPGGIIDLASGAVLAHAPGRYLTKRTAVPIAPHGTPHPVWDRFLVRVADGDTDLIAFLQRIAGYCLTGHTREHAIFFLFGGGANGKSLFLRTLAAVMGDYATTAPMETFMTSTHDRHPTDLADLRGARLVFATETEEGRRWAEAKLKQLSGGDPVKARYMRENFFQFQPQFKLLFAGNHKPSLRNIDEAIRRRFHLLHFKVIIPVEERDPGLYDKLRAEWPAILRWMLEGCLAWQQAGLKPSASVAEATAEYLATEDTLQIWLDERTERDAMAWARTATLHGSYRTWAAAAGEHGMNEKRFAQALEDRGYLRKRGPGGLRGFAGVTLKETSE